MTITCIHYSSFIKLEQCFLSLLFVPVSLGRQKDDGHKKRLDPHETRAQLENREINTAYFVNVDIKMYFA